MGLKKCLKWFVKVLARCPYCLEIEYYDRYTKRGKTRKVIECRKCHARFRLGTK